MRTQTIWYPNAPVVLANASIVGPKEGEGPLGWCFDEVLTDDKLGQKTWEMAETELIIRTAKMCLEKGGMVHTSVDCMIGGDLINQIMPTSFAARMLEIPFLGIYGACSTIVESIMLGAALVDGGYRAHALCMASSHFSTAERQFRFPLALGNQKPPSAQRTTTAAGVFLVGGVKAPQPNDVVLHCGTMGKVKDYQITDTNHMGAAMAPAAADTLLAHFRDTGHTHEQYDLIATGDLGIFGRKLLLELLHRAGMPVPEEKMMDCGASMFSPDQDTHAGGSGCGCMASVLSGLFMNKLTDGKARSILVMGTGSLHSPTSAQQGESIPAIAHAVALKRRDAL